MWEIILLTLYTYSAIPLIGRGHRVSLFSRVFHVILDASERRPPTVEIERVGLVDILLGEVAEVKIESELANGVARVELDEDLRHLRHRHTADVHAVSHAVRECDVEHLQAAAVLGQAYVLATRGDNFISMRHIQSLKGIANVYPACAALTSTH